MKFARTAALILIPIAYGAPGLAQGSSPNLAFMMSLTGTCSKLVIDGGRTPCDGTLLHTDYNDGRIGFYFVAEKPDAMAVTFSGFGPKQSAPSENVRVQPIDSVILKDGTVQVSGSCTFENPFVGPALIECEAASPAGALYYGHFISDGREPKMIGVSE